MSYQQSSAIIGAGASIAYCPTQNGAYTIFLETIKVPTTAPNVAKVDVTNNQSPNYTKEKIPGFMDNDDISFTANYLRAQQTLIRGMLRTKQWFQVTYSDGMSDTFYGWLSKIGASSDAPDNKITSDFSITVSGLSITS
jgi:hypothetical protein